MQDTVGWPNLRAGMATRLNSYIRAGFRESVARTEWTEGVAGHRRIIDPLKAGRLRVADRALRAHIEDHRARLESAR